MSNTKFFGDNYKMLVTVLAILVININYILSLASGTNIHKMSPTSKFSLQHHGGINCIVTSLSFVNLAIPTSADNIRDFPFF